MRRYVLSRAWPVRAAAFLLAAAPLPAQSADEEREDPRVKEIRFVGLRAADEGELRDGIATRESRCRSPLLLPICLFSKSPTFFERHYLDRAELRRDVLRIRVFHWRRGYRETQVDTVVTPDGDEVTVTFRVAEGPPTRVSAIRVDHPDTILSRREVRRAMLLERGEPLDLLKLDSSLVLLRDALWERGYADAVIRADTSTNDSLRTAAVSVSIEPGALATVGSIQIGGNRKIAERTIRNSLALKPGETFRRSDVIESQRNLYASHLFTSATVVVPQQSDSVKDVRVAVREAPLRAARVSAGFNTVDFVQVEGRFTNYNFYGRARRLELRGVLGNLLARQLNGSGIFTDVTPDFAESEARPYLRPTWQASVDLTQPWFRSPRNTISVGMFAARRSAPTIFIDHSYGVNAAFTRQLTAASSGTATYRFELTEVNAGDVYFCQNSGVCQLETIDALRDRQRLSPLGLSFLDDHANDPLFPTNGHVWQFDAEHASALTVSDFRYNRLSAQATKYVPLSLWQNGVLAVRLRGGWARPLASTREAVGIEADSAVGILHPRKRFYAGGSQSVRGYGENQLGPRILTVDPDTLKALAGCTDESILSRDPATACDPQLRAVDGRTIGVPSDEFQPRPTGGTTLLEANVEYRLQIWQKLWAAVFVDAAYLGEGELRDITGGTGAITPGFGFRYLSPVGPIRVDLGIRPTLAEQLPVATEVTLPSGETRIVTLVNEKTYDPLEDSKSGIRQVLDRLNLHLSIGEAF